LIAKNELSQFQNNIFMMIVYIACGIISMIRTAYIYFLVDSAFCTLIKFSMDEPISLYFFVNL